MGLFDRKKEKQNTEKAEKVAIAPEQKPVLANKPPKNDLEDATRQLEMYRQQLEMYREQLETKAKGLEEREKEIEKKEKALGIR
ncbi:MAG: hypothetical protein ACMUHM_04020 [Thermoplasmatota archaeon]